MCVLCFASPPTLTWMWASFPGLSCLHHTTSPFLIIIIYSKERRKPPIFVIVHLYYTLIETSAALQYMQCAVHPNVQVAWYDMKMVTSVLCVRVGDANVLGYAILFLSFSFLSPHSALLCAMPRASYSWQWHCSLQPPQLHKESAPFVNVRRCACVRPPR